MSNNRSERKIRKKNQMGGWAGVEPLDKTIPINSTNIFPHIYIHEFALLSQKCPNTHF